MKSAIGFIFLALALYYVYNSTKKTKKIQECDGHKIVATITDNKIQIINGAMCVYYPVYSYEVNGEIRTYQSSTPSSMALQLGMQVPMYYNLKTETPVEAVSALTDVVIAAIFGVLSIILLSWK